MDYTTVFVLACIFIPLERLIPLHENQPALRRGWINDLIYVLVNGFFVRAGFTAIAGVFMLGFTQVFGSDPLPWIKELPIWVQIIAVIIIADIGYYSAHRLSHTIPFLWKFHSVHHSIEDMDWLATHRVHPVDQIFTNVFSLLPIWCIGFSIEALFIQQIMYQAQALLVHSNTKINFGPLKWLIASPEYHHWHHANEHDAYDKNFAAQLSIIDVVAGTIFMPFNRRPKVYGLNEEMPPYYHQQLLYPFKEILGKMRRSTKKAKLYTKEQKMTSYKPAKPFEDFIGKMAMIAVFGYIAVQSLTSFYSLVLSRSEIPLWGLAMFSQAISLGFILLILYYTITRLPPTNSAAGLAPRITAIAGTFVMTFLVIMPPDPVSEPMRILSTLLVTVGAAASMWALHQLGRSFSIMASSRELKTQGVYALVRHPLYAAEVMMIIGVVLGHGSIAAYGLGALWLVLQVRRAQYEELVLRATFPEYTEYASRVPMLIPGLKLNWLENELQMKETKGQL
jgi:sterol desaturase/sphingolipid hydroxylase (fatty acid hydroxylase superfamily)/protein-S-isoprenylcysteine O-methyltransferase Ste14